MTIISTDQTSSGGTTFISSTNNDRIFIREGVLVSHVGTGSGPDIPSAMLISETNVGLTTAGTIYSEYFSAVSITAGGAFVMVRDTGLIQNNSSAHAAFSVETGTGGSISLYNQGDIQGVMAVRALGGQMVVRNGGLIEGMVLGIQGAYDVQNTGSIIGQTAISTTSFADSVVNLGLILGDVLLLVGDDVFDTIGGRFDGRVFGGGGDDVYRTDSATLEIFENALEGIDRVEATVSFDLDIAAEVENLTLIGTAATDGKGNMLGNSILGNMAANRIWGVEGEDTLDGGWGDDRIFGGSGNDAVFGGMDNDTLRGGTGNDTLTGGAEDDLLFGDIGNDRLVGSDGDDTLTGGAGKDALFGGLDADTFRFAAVSDSAAGTATRDQITGFQTGVDLIALTLIDANTQVTGNQAFTFIGLSEFSNVAGQLRAVHGTNSLLLGDVNGDGVADFEVALVAVGSIAVNDLLL